MIGHKSQRKSGKAEYIDFIHMIIFNTHTTTGNYVSATVHNKQFV